MARRILISLDGSQLAEQVLPHVKALVERQGAEVHLLSVAPVIDNVAASVMLYPWYVYREQLADRVLRASSCLVLLVRAVIK